MAVQLLVLVQIAYVIVGLSNADLCHFQIQLKKDVVWWRSVDLSCKKLRFIYLFVTFLNILPCDNI